MKLEGWARSCPSSCPGFQSQSQVGFSVCLPPPISCSLSGNPVPCSMGTLRRGGALRLFPLPWKFNSSVSLKSKITRKTSLSRFTQECSTHGLQPGCSWEWGSQGQTGLQPSHWVPKSASTPGSLASGSALWDAASGADRGNSRLVQGVPQTS